MEYQDNASPTGIVSGDWGVEKITLAATSFTGRGSDQPCREIIVWAELDKTVMIGNTAAEAVTGLPLLTGITASATGQYLRLSLSNTNKLFFKGTAEDDVYILWRT